MAHVPGLHGLLDLYGCPADVLSCEGSLKDALLKAAGTVGATVLFEHFHSFGTGQGITGVLLLAESHISIHTWPEYGFAAADVFLCGSQNPADAAAVLRHALKAQESRWREYRRGRFPVPAPANPDRSGSLKP